MKSIRGKNTFNEIFVGEQSQSLSRKGRSETLNKRRNECLLERYYFLGRTTQSRYELIIEALSKEFFLSTVTVPKIIDANYSDLLQIKQQFHDVPDEKLKKKLQAKWPHIMWQLSTV